MLNFKADAPELYEIPAKGRHYTEIWDEEDGLPLGTTPRFPVPALRQGMMPGHGAGVGHFVPATEMREEFLVDENKGLGNLTERIVAGIVAHPRSSSSASLEVDAGVYEGNRDVARVDVVDLEDRVKRELRGSMLLGDQEEVSLMAPITGPWLTASTPA
jgi:transcriptional adapter 3